MADFSTPESAIQSLEAAYKAKDIEAAIACKHFRAEAQLMLQLGNPQFAQDEEIISQTAEVLELSYRTEIAKKGFPDFEEIELTFSETKQVNDQLVIVTEVCKYPDGLMSNERLYVYRTDEGWRVLNPVGDEPEKKMWWQFWKP